MCITQKSLDTCLLLSKIETSFAEKEKHSALFQEIFNRSN